MPRVQPQADDAHADDAVRGENAHREDVRQPGDVEEERERARDEADPGLRAHRGVVGRADLGEEAGGEEAVPGGKRDKVNFRSAIGVADHKQVLKEQLFDSWDGEAGRKEPSLDGSTLRCVKEPQL